VARVLSKISGCGPVIFLASGTPVGVFIISAFVLWLVCGGAVAKNKKARDEMIAGALLVSAVLFFINLPLLAIFNGEIWEWYNRAPLAKVNSMIGAYELDARLSEENL
jgi:hypothetical protein